MSRRIINAAEAGEWLLQFEEKMEGWRGDQPLRAQVAVTVPKEEKVNVMALRQFQRRFLDRKARDYKTTTQVRPESHSYALFAMTKEAKEASKIVISRAAHQELVDALAIADPDAPILSVPKLPEIALGAFSRDLISRHQLITLLQNTRLDEDYKLEDNGSDDDDEFAYSPALIKLLTTGLPTRLIVDGELTAEAIEAVTQAHTKLDEGDYTDVPLDVVLQNFKQLLLALPKSEQSCRMRLGLKSEDDSLFHVYEKLYTTRIFDRGYKSLEKSSWVELKNRFEGLKLQSGRRASQSYFLEYMLSAGANDALMLSLFGEDYSPNYPVFGVIPYQDVLSGGKHEGASVRPSQVYYPGTRPPSHVHGNHIKTFRQNQEHDFAHALLQSEAKRPGQQAKRRLLRLLDQYLLHSQHDSCSLQWLIGDSFGVDEALSADRTDASVAYYFNGFFDRHELEDKFQESRGENGWSIVKPIEHALYVSGSVEVLSDFAIMLACDFVINCDAWADLGVTAEVLAARDLSRDSDRILVALYTKAFDVVHPHVDSFSGKSALHQVLLFRCLQHQPDLFESFAMRLDEFSPTELEAFVTIKRDNRKMLLTSVDGETKQPLYEPDAFDRLVDRLGLTASVTLRS